MFMPQQKKLCTKLTTWANTNLHLCLLIGSMIGETLNYIPQVSLAVPNCDHFVQVSLTVLDAIAKAKKLICESIAHNLMPVSLTKSFLALAMAFNLLLSNLTLPPFPKLKNLFVSETCWDIFSN